MNPMITSGNFRFTVLTDRLIRCECQRDGKSTDSPTQTVISRDLDAVEITREKIDGWQVIRTPALAVFFREDAETFSPETLRIEANDDSFRWKYGIPNPEDLPGTLRTLDNADGLTNLQTGEIHQLRGSIISRQGWTVLDDSRTLVLKPDGFLVPREGAGGEDLYFFGYGQDYSTCLRDYHHLTGNAPLIPKFALGLWWSKWWPYKDSDLLEIIQRFEDHGVPLSVCVIDMDWHQVKNPHHNGWTGYSWNPEYFPEPEEFFRTIHSKGVHACMNLHPHQGVAPHEAGYERICERLGRDPEKKEIVPFELGNEEFLRAYFEELHHPLEAQGVDFWWMDWQQGASWDLAGVDPLWYLNHLHARDLARNGGKRPLVFSRWANHASHRYPVGFSGDTYATWKTLNVLPYFTAASANLGYGWRSDETGGFFRGDINDHELFTRWNQFACFSPTYRLHNCGDPGFEYLPWKKPEPFRAAILATMRLRRELLPYLYTAAHVHSGGGPCLCRPMYHDHPQSEEAYLVPQQYFFGPDLIVAPFTRPIESETGLARQVVWLPEGTWFDFFSGASYDGGRFHSIYGTVADIPVFARAGSTIPLMRNGRTHLRIFPGEGVSFFYDDDGTSLDYQAGEFALTRLEQSLREGRSECRVSHENGSRPGTTDFEMEYVEARSRRLAGPALQKTLLGFHINCHTLRPLIGKPNIDYDATKYPYHPVLDAVVENPARLLPYLADFTQSQAYCLFEQLTDSGFHSENLHDGRTALIYWCGEGRSGCEASVALSQRLYYEYSAAQWTPETRYAFAIQDLRSSFNGWKAQVCFGSIFALDRANS